MGQDFPALVADVYELAGALRRLGETTAATEGQTQARWQLLSAISTGDMTVPRAARRLGVTRQAVQRVANDLTSDGLTQFDENPDHRSSPLLTLTPSGDAVLAAINRRAATQNRVLARRIGPDTLAALSAGVGELIDAVDGL